MAAFRQILNRQKNSEGGIFSSNTSDQNSSNAVEDKLNNIHKNIQIVAKNSIVFPSMSKDISLMQKNLVKLVKLQSENSAIKSKAFFSRQSAREESLESKQRTSRSTSPSSMTAKSNNGGFLGFLGEVLTGAAGFIARLFASSPLLFTAGAAGLLGLLYSNKDFKDAIKNMVVGIFNLIAKGFSGFQELLKDEDVRSSIKSAVKSFFNALGEFLMLPVGNIFGVDIPLGAAILGIVGALGAFQLAIASVIGVLGVLTAKALLPGGVPGTGRGMPGNKTPPGAPSGPRSGAPVPGVPVPNGTAPGNKPPPKGGGKPLSSFGSVGEKREMAKNKPLIDKIIAKLKQLGSSPKAMSLLSRALAKRFGVAAAAGIAASFFSGGVLAPIVFGLLAVYGAVDLIASIDEAIDEMKKDASPTQEQKPETNAQLISRLISAPETTTPNSGNQSTQTSRTPSAGTRSTQTSTSPIKLSDKQIEGIDLLNRLMDQEGIDDPQVRHTILALAQKESSMDPNARGPTIPKGMHKGDQAHGLLQVMPKTAEDMGFSRQDIRDPEKAAKAGLQYFLKNYKRLGTLESAVVSHHAGPRRGAEFLRTGSVRTKDSATNISTMDYLADVMSNSKNIGSTISTASTQIADARSAMASQNPPGATNVNQINNVDNSGKNSSSSGQQAETFDVDLIKLLLSTQS